MKKQEKSLINPFEEPNAFMKIVDSGLSGIEDKISTDGIEKKLEELNYILKDIRDLLATRLK
jgi:hypothetical protein